MRVCIVHGRDNGPVELIYLLLGMGIEAESLPLTTELARKLRADAIDDVIFVLSRLGRQELGIIEECEGRCGYVMVSELSDKDRLALLSAGAKHIFAYPAELRQFASIFKEQNERRRLIRARVMSEVFRCGSVRFQAADRLLVSAGGDVVRLTAGETQVLALLVLNANRVLSRAAINKGLGRGPVGVASRAIDVVASALRRKLAKIGATTELVSVRTEGYRLDGPWTQMSLEDVAPAAKETHGE